MTTITNSLFESATKLRDELVENRRYIHAHPELSFEEHKTVDFVRDRLLEMGLQPRIFANGIGVTAEIGTDGPIVGIRADMDALPIEEENDVDYKSSNRGVMHACGHDVHTACALGAARLLVQTPPAHGRVRLIFQPAEESTNADGKSGAMLLLEEGAFDGVKSVVGLHVFPELPTGLIALRDGPFLAACAKFNIEIRGQGCHGAFPQEGVDAIVLASYVIQAIQTIISRRKSALDPAVVTIGGIKSNSYRANIVCELVEMLGTARYFREETADVIQAELEKCCQIVEGLGGSYSLNFRRESPALVNSRQIVETVSDVAAKMLGPEAVVEAPMEMGAEDFSFVSAKYPSCFFALGTKLNDRPRKLHTATFDIDESAMPIGAAILAASALRLCSE